MPKKPSLLPKEHGAYAELSFPLVTGLALGEPNLASFSLGLAAVLFFLANEPVAVLLGARGEAPQRPTGGPGPDAGLFPPGWSHRPRPSWDLERGRGHLAGAGLPRSCRRHPHPPGPNGAPEDPLWGVRGGRRPSPPCCCPWRRPPGLIPSGPPLRRPCGGSPSLWERWRFTPSRHASRTRPRASGRSGGRRWRPDPWSPGPFGWPWGWPARCWEGWPLRRGMTSREESAGAWASEAMRLLPPAAAGTFPSGPGHSRPLPGQGSSEAPEAGGVDPCGREYAGAGPTLPGRLTEFWELSRTIAQPPHKLATPSCGGLPPMASG